MTTPVVNPATFTITDANVLAEGVTSFTVDFGTTAGQYTLHATVPVSSLSVSGNNYTGTFTNLHQTLAGGTWFTATRATNANGISVESPETSFVIVPPVPSAPSGFTVA